MTSGTLEDDEPLAESAGVEDGAEPVASVSPAPEKLGKKAVAGSIWAVSGFAGAQVLRFTSSMILTRLLVPRDFGTMLLVTEFAQGLQMFSDIGIGPSIVRSDRGDDANYLRTAWTIQIVRGFFLWVCAVALAKPWAWFFEDPKLAVLLPVTGLVALISGFNSTAVFSSRRHLTLHRLTMLELVGQGAGIIVAVAIAWFRPSVWALVAQTLTAAFVKMALSFVWLKGIRHYPHWDREASRSMFRFGKWIFLNTVISFLAMHLDRFALGKLATKEMLGVFGTAVNIARMPRQLLQHVSITVVYPLIAKVRHDKERFVPTVGRARTICLLLTAPICAGFCAGGVPLVHIAYDNRYAQAGPWLSLISVGVWCEAMWLTYARAVMVSGMPKFMTAGSALKAFTLLALVVPVYREWDVPGVAVLNGACELCLFLTCGLGARKLGVLAPWSDLGLSLYFGGLTLVFWLAQKAGLWGAEHWLGDGIAWLAEEILGRPKAVGRLTYLVSMIPLAITSLTVMGVTIWRARKLQNRPAPAANPA